MQLTHELESAWFQPLNLKCDFLVSKFALNVTCCTATHWQGMLRAKSEWEGKLVRLQRFVAAMRMREVGLYKLNSVDP
jgi:hypothetical protein